jgi:glycosyltransferase involved in cell wall biosynthesis
MSAFFSIIVPAYNVEKYIDRAISSVLNQSFQDFEIIIVNDGSVDKTANVIEGYAKKNEKIHVVNHLKNESLHIARLDGVAVSNGQYVVFLDGDDYFSDNALNILYDEIQKNPGYDFYEYGYIEQPDGKVVLPSFTEGDRFTAYFSKDNYPAHTMWNKVYDSILIKKAFSALERVYINNAEDAYESIVISYYAKNIFLIKKVIINYSFGTGISTTYKDYKKTLEYMQSIKTMIILTENFIAKINQNVNIDDFNFHFLSNTVGYINTQNNIEEKKKLFHQLSDFFDIKIILEYLSDREELYKESYNKLNTIASSKDYRLGRKILYPLRKLKRLLFFLLKINS